MGFQLRYARPVAGAQRIDVALLIEQDVMLTMDGQVGVSLRERDIVEVQKAEALIRLVRFPQKDFFSVLRAAPMLGRTFTAEDERETLTEAHLDVLNPVVGAWLGGMADQFFPGDDPETLRRL